MNKKKLFALLLLLLFSQREILAQEPGRSIMTRRFSYVKNSAQHTIMCVPLLQSKSEFYILESRVFGMLAEKKAKEAETLVHAEIANNKSVKSRPVLRVAYAGLLGSILNRSEYPDSEKIKRMTEQLQECIDLKIALNETYDASEREQIALGIYRLRNFVNRFEKFKNAMHYKSELQKCPWFSELEKNGPLREIVLPASDSNLVAKVYLPALYWGVLADRGPIVGSDKERIEKGLPGVCMEALEADHSSTLSFSVAPISSDSSTDRETFNKSLNGFRELQKLPDPLKWFNRSFLSYKTNGQMTDNPESIKISGIDGILYKLEGSFIVTAVLGNDFITYVLYLPKEDIGQTWKDYSKAYLGTVFVSGKVDTNSKPAEARSSSK